VDDAVFFASPREWREWREWLEVHGASLDACWVGFWKQGTGQPSLTWDESVDEALCFGWIDGIRKSVDDERYRIRFTPRRARSKWSAKNLRRFDELEATGLVQPAGRAALERRTEAPAGCSFEQRTTELPPQYQQRFEDEPAAWAFFAAQPPGYRSGSIHWVTSAQREETRLRRLATLISDSANGERLKQLRR
jgi:uncharacterized protein YdeI (YjbR/CyaY-like superfamily)